MEWVERAYSSHSHPWSKWWIAGGYGGIYSILHRTLGECNEFHYISLSLRVCGATNFLHIPFVFLIFSFSSPRLLMSIILRHMQRIRRPTDVCNRWWSSWFSRRSSRFQQTQRTAVGPGIRPGFDNSTNTTNIHKTCGLYLVVCYCFNPISKS